MKKRIPVLVLIVLVITMGVGQIKEDTDKLKEHMTSFFKPAPTQVVPDPIVIVKEVQKSGRLETTSITLQRVVQAEKNTDKLGGLFGEKLLFVAQGKVLIGVDLKKIQPQDIKVVNDESVQVKLPKAEILEIFLDTENSYVFDRSKGLLAKNDPQMESQVRRKSLESIREAVLNSNILDISNENAKLFIKDFLRNLGFQKVNFIS